MKGSLGLIMSAIDIILITILVSFTVASALWGIIRQVIAVGGLIVGIILAGIYSSQLAGWFGFMNNPEAAKGLAYVLIVALVSMLASTVASVLYFMAGLLFLGVFDHALGALLGLVQGVIVAGVFFVGALSIAPDWTQAQLAQSQLSNHVSGFFTTIALIPAPDLKDFVDRIAAVIPRS